MFSPYGLAGLILALGACAAVVAAGLVGRRPLRIGAIVIGGVLGFQLFHVFEHGVQAVVWAGNPTAKPWMSSWATGTANGAAEWFSFLAPGARMALGMELLHLFGNVIFLAGIGAMLAVPALASPVQARWAFGVQGLHVLEHVVLTTTLVATGTAHGVSTMLDDVLPINGVTGRVLFHFGINAVGTVFALEAVRRAGWPAWAHALGLRPRQPVDGPAVPAGLGAGTATASQQA